MIGGLMKTTSYLAIAAAASLIVGSVTLAPTAARAADLGGDCCADLESRVAELEATTVRKGNRKVSVTLSGAVTSGILFWNDGIENDANVITPDTIGGGFTFAGSGKVSSDFTVGYNLGFDARFGDPGDGTGLQADAPKGYSAVGKIAPVEVYVYMDSKSIGRLTVGHRSSAYKSANGRSDLGGDSGANAYNGGIIDLAAGIQIRDAAGNFLGSWYNALDNIGGIRGETIRYDSPTMGGFQVSASLGHNDSQLISGVPAVVISGGDDVASVALGYDASHGGTDVSLSAAYQAETETVVGTESRWLIGASLFNKPSGLFVTGEYDAVQNNQNTKGGSANNWFIKGGWRKNVNGMGETAVYGGFQQTKDIVSLNVTGKGFFVGVTQSIDPAASLLYGQFQHLSADGTGTPCVGGCKDENSWMMGLKVAF